MQELERGDVVVHPQHGPAAVRGFAERAITGRAKRYVELETLGSGMRIKAPVKRLGALGVRWPMTDVELDGVLDVLRAASEPTEPRWTERVKVAERRLKSGLLEDAATVARDVWRREKGSGASYAEVELKKKAVNRVGLEVAAVQGTTLEDALGVVEDAIFAAAPEGAPVVGSGAG